ncbi:MAG: hypothetical protein Q9160_009098 [Pyrenula sp. 1 TL-2023]
MSLPTTQKAIVMSGAGQGAHLTTTRPLPTLRPGYLLIKTAAVALNPTDWKHLEGAENRSGHLSGCDYAGTVAAISDSHDVTKKWEVGDRIAGMAHGGNGLQPEDGAFAEWIVVKADVGIRVPRGMGWEEAATLGVGCFTVGQGLYQSLGLELPPEDGKEKEGKEKEYVLIYGGSTATGNLGIQFAKASGYLPITTCSPHNFPLVTSAGAIAAFDYKSPDTASKIRSLTNNSLRLAWDCISLPPSAKLCADALAPSGPIKYASILSVDFPRSSEPKVSTFRTLAYSHIGETFEKFGNRFEASTVDFNFAKMWALVCERLLAEGRVKVHPPRVESGIEGVVEGMQRLKRGEVSGEKLVFTVG